MGGMKRVRRLLAQGTVVGLLLVAAVPIVAFGGDGDGARVDAPGFTDKLFTGPSIVPSLFENAPVKAVAISPANEIVVGPGILGVRPGFTDGVLTGPSIVPSLIEGVPSGAARVTLPAPRIEAPGVSDGVLTGPSIVPSLFEVAPLARVVIDPANRIVVGAGIVGELPGYTDGVLTGPSVVPGLFQVVG